MRPRSNVSPPVLRAVLLVAAWLARAPAGQAQPPTKPAPTAAELKKSVARIKAGTEGESDAFDKLVETTARGLVAYLKAHEVTAAQASYLGLEYLASPDAAPLKVFTYTYSSGGTRGTIHRPVFQWQNATGQRFAYSFSEEWGFSELYKLRSPPGRAQYLLLGAEKGDGRCLHYQAYVVELKGNYLLLDKPAFGARPSFNLCNVPMEFDPARQVLRLDLTDYSTEHDSVLLPEWGRPTGKSMSLKFSSGHFVRSR